MNVWRITRPLVASALLAAAAGIPTGLCSDLATTSTIPIPTTRAHDALALEVLSTDATSVRLAWQPQELYSYDVLRDGVSVGLAGSRLGRFSDFGLTPHTTYEYRVIAYPGDGTSITSSPVVARTTKTQRIKADYTVLAIAFEAVPNPTEALLDEIHARNRIQFIELASQGSVKIHLYNDTIFRSRQRLTLDSTTQTVHYPMLVGQIFGWLGSRSIIDLVENGDVDQVWIFGGSHPFLENALIGSRLIQGNGLTTPNTWTPIAVNCSRSFFIHHSSIDERSYDAYAHMVEGIMTSVSDGHPETWPRNQRYITYTPDRTSYATRVNMLNEFERFRLADQWNGTSPVAYASPGNGNAGSSHFPPNSRRDCIDYCYYSPDTWRRYIYSSADDWLSYPKGSGEKRKLNGYDFGAFNHYTEGDQSYAAMLLRSPENHSSFQISSASFHQWWFAHLPHNPGVTDGRLNNWWPYIFDFNRFDGSAISYRVTGFDDDRHRFKSNHGEYGTDTTDSGDWGYWHSLNGFSPGGKIAELSTVNRSTSPENVISGRHAVHVMIDSAQYWDYLGAGRNDMFYPRSRDAHWNLRDLSRVRLSIKPETNPSLLSGTNPIVRIYKNGGNRIELVPRNGGRYVNLLGNGSPPNANGWFTFDIPLTGNATWEKNLIGYIDPSLPDAELQAARARLEREILSDVNYVEISIRSVVPAPVIAHEQISYYIDNLRLITR